MKTRQGDKERPLRCSKRKVKEFKKNLFLKPKNPKSEGCSYPRSHDSMSLKPRYSGLGGRRMVVTGSLEVAHIPQGSSNVQR